MKCIFSFSLWDGTGNKEKFKKMSSYLLVFRSLSHSLTAKEVSLLLLLSSLPSLAIETRTRVVPISGPISKNMDV